MQPKYKLIVSIVAIAGLSASALFPLLTRHTAQAVLVAVGLGAIALWLVKSRSTLNETLAPAPRLRVITKIGLSLKSGLTLVELDGKPLLVAHGDGFASFHAPHAATSSWGDGEHPRAPFKQTMESVS
jgi:hypothetical protein